MLAIPLHRKRSLRLCDREGQVHHAIGVLAAHLVPGVGENAQHGAVGRQHLGHEPLDAHLPGGGGQMFQQHRTDAASLVGVLDHERDLGVGRVRAQPLVAAHADQVRAGRDDQRLAIDVVHVDEAVQVPWRDARVGREVAEVPGPLGEAAVHRDHRVGIGRVDLSQVDGGAIRQQDLCRPADACQSRASIGSSP